MHETSILDKIKPVETSVYFEHENDPSVSTEDNEILGYHNHCSFLKQCYVAWFC
jgi:hypothetical protein